MKFETKTITPEMAKVMLTKNGTNRKLRRRIVAEYAKDMKSGRWLGNTGEGIKFGDNNELLDGQHRLNAIMAAGVGVKMLVVTGLSTPDVFGVIDSGLKRSSGDALYTMGIKNASIVSSIIKAWNSLKVGSGRTNASGEIQSLTNSQVVELYYDRQKFWQEIARESVNYYSKIYKAVSPTFIGAIWAYFYDINKTQADKFMENLCEGFGEQGCPTKTLRDRLINEATQQRGIKTRVKYGLAVKAWNMYCEGRKGRLVFDISKEVFPTAK